MMGPIEKLIKELAKLPGIGEKSAARLAYHVVRGKKEDASSLASAISDAKAKIRFCSSCFNLTEQELCLICSSGSRNKGIVCVVEHPQDASAVEKTGSFSGIYHILHGSISPLDGMGPDDVKITELIERLKTKEVKELIIATNPTSSGEATALYIQKLAKPFGVKITRIAFGIPFGGDIEYTDKATLARAMELRSEIRNL